jgi:hypothetical protein
LDGHSSFRTTNLGSLMNVICSNMPCKATRRSRDTMTAGPQASHLLLAVEVGVQARFEVLVLAETLFQLPCGPPSTAAPLCCLRTYCSFG